MLISYKWIQKYFEKPLPSPEELADILTMHAYEIDGIENKKSADGKYEDTIFDVKVLPDRAPYALSHRYMAQEVGALIQQDVRWPEIFEITEGETNRKLEVLIDKNVLNKKLCSRYIGRVVEGIAVTPSPAWLRHQLEVLGQRSINSIVDLTNYVMLETGEPLHAFDADKIEGKIEVRMAKGGEEIILLDGTAVKLSASSMFIADEAGPLVIAGIKGGKRAEVTSETKNIILEAACFDRTNVRRTSQALGIRSESSKRFENGVTPERAGLAMAEVSGHVLKLNESAVIGEAVDVYPHLEEPIVIEASEAKIFERLGIEVPRQRTIDILTRLGLEIEEGDGMLKLGIPPYRPDLRITEDIAEEIGRVYGYDKVPEKVPSARSNRQSNKNFYYFNIIRKTLVEQGFSEVYTYSIVDNGDMAIQNPLTVERSHMRNSITDLLPSKFLFNMRNIDFLGLKDIRMFEIGKIFGGKSERNALAFGIARAKLQKGVDSKHELTEIAKSLEKALSVPTASSSLSIKWAEIKGDAQTACAGFVGEIELDEIIAKLPDPKEDVDLSTYSESISDGRRFAAISPYPFSTRDVAVFVPGGAGKDTEVLDVILGALSSSQKEIVAKTNLFDVFTKAAKNEGEKTRTSYAYRLVFQAKDRTLTQEEVDGAMKAITKALGEKGWEVR